MGFRCIKLDAAWKPIDIISWEKAFWQVYIEPYPCNVLHEYPEKYKIRSAYQQWSYPSIIVLKNYVKHKKEKISIKPSLKAILIRDMFTCAYCSDKLTTSTGTRDHVIPEAKGGPSSWSNLVACCKECQNKKKDYLPEQINMFPSFIPKAPLLEERFSKYIKIASAFERKNWIEGLNKIGLNHLINIDDE